MLANRSIKLVSFGLSLLLFGSLLAVLLLGPQIRSFQQPINQPGLNSYEVKAGSHLRRLAKDFEARGWVENANIFHYWYRLQGKAEAIKAGEFPLNSGDSVADLMQRIVTGQTLQHPVAVVEGARFRDFRAALKAAPGLKQETAAWTDAQIMVAMGAPDQHPEGMFFPDTYLYSKGTSDLTILRQAYQRMQQTLQREWAAKADGLPLKNAYEALILASIIEKETGLGSERAEIAGVFVRRLQKGMKLQTDPTIIYGMGDRYDGNIRRKDIREATPYNTYVIRGLPPTPIALPGAAAIHATLHPADGEALYFVAKGDGSHYFSATLEEHNRAVRKYQLKR